MKRVISKLNNNRLSIITTDELFGYNYFVRVKPLDDKTKTAISIIKPLMNDQVKELWLCIFSEHTQKISLEEYIEKLLKDGYEIYAFKSHMEAFKFIINNTKGDE